MGGGKRGGGGGGGEGGEGVGGEGRGVGEEGGGIWWWFLGEEGVGMGHVWEIGKVKAMEKTSVEYEAS